MNVESINRYREQFASLEDRLAGAGRPRLRHARRAALRHVIENGLPTTRDEDWKYTNVAAIEKHAFEPAPLSTQGVDMEQVKRLVWPDTHRLVFIDGCYAPALSQRDAMPSGVTLENLAAAIAHGADCIETRFPFDDETIENGFMALNAAFWRDGAYLGLAAGVKVEQPIHWFFIATRPELAIHPRNLIHAAENSRATVVEHFATIDENAAYFTNTITRIVTAQGAAIDHVRLQQESGQAFHIAGIHAKQAQDSRFASHAFTLGALLSRCDITTHFDAEGGSAALNGLYIAGGRQHLDHHTRIDHAQPRCVSREMYKGVLDGAARAVFQGKLIVHLDAQQSDAHQTNHNLLLSEHAEADSSPQLEIYADDVRCSHGATVGQLDEQQIFYLRSRGIDAATAKSMLTCAFAEEIISRIAAAPLRDRLRDLLYERLNTAAKEQ